MTVGTLYTCLALAALNILHTQFGRLHAIVPTVLVQLGFIQVCTHCTQKRFTSHTKRGHGTVPVLHRQLGKVCLIVHTLHTRLERVPGTVHTEKVRETVYSPHTEIGPCGCAHYTCSYKRSKQLCTHARAPHKHTYSDSAHTTRAVRKGLLDCAYPMHAVRKSPCECAHSTQKRSMRLCTQSTLEKIHAIVYTPQSVRKGPRDLPLARPLLWARPPSSQSHRPEEALRTPTEPRQHGRPAPPTVPSPAKPAGGRHPGQCPRPGAHSPGRPRRL